jgi:hypothetical protein
MPPLATPLGLFSFAIYLGRVFALLGGGWVVGKVSAAGLWTLPIVGDMRPWQAVFLLIGLPGLAISLLMRTIREPERGAMGGATSALQLPIAAVAAYVRRHAGAFLGHNLGFALIGMVNYGWAFWVPTFLIRNHGWTAQHAGLIYGLWTATFGVAGVVVGGYLSDVLARRGHSDAKLRIGLIGVAGELASGFLFLFAPTAVMEAALIPSTFFASFGFGAAAAAIQEVTPVPMRAQVSALYLFIINLIGLAIGSTFVAALTDYVFKSDLAIRESLLVVTVVGLVLAAVSFLLALGPFRRAAAAVATWRPDAEPGGTLPSQRPANAS